MHEGTKRAALYGGAALLLALLVWAGFVRTVDPDLMTALGAANMQLRLANAIPAQDKDGQALTARAQLLASAAQNLGAAARQAPDSPVVAELQGFLQSLRGDPRGAATAYRRARTLPGCEREQHDTLVFNEARMLAAAGDSKAALAVFDDCGASLQPEYSDQRSLEESVLLHALGRDRDALLRLDRVMQSSQEPMAWLQAGLDYELLGRTDAADAAFVRAAGSIPVADYHRARLKLAAGDVDSCLGLLERAAKAKPAEVRRLLREDAAAWRVVAGDARWQQIAAPAQAAPGR